jgi:cell division protein FtsB
MTSPVSHSVEPPGLRWGRKLLVGVALALTAALVLVVFFSHRGLYQVYRFRQEKLRLEQENSRLSAENERLARTIDRLQHDPEMIQDLIRRELNFIKKNEVILQLPPAAPLKPVLPPPPAAAPPETPPPQAP